MRFTPFSWILVGLLLASDPGIQGVAQQPPRIPAMSTDQRADTTVPATLTLLSTSLDTLMARALAYHPSIRAARAHFDAARARASAAGTRPDPMLMAGVQNLPLGTSPMNGGGPDPMTMRMVGISQTIPYPGKLPLDRTAAAAEVTAAAAALDGARRQVIADVQGAYADLVFLNDALRVVEQNHTILAGLAHVAETHYSVGTATQAEVLKVNVELIRLAETANMLTEQRTATLARLNALVGRPNDASVNHPSLPLRVLRAALGASPDSIRFTSAALGARVAGSPIPAVTTLQAIAARDNPEALEQEALIAAQTARVALAHKASLPDVDVSLQYGQRGGGLPDMISATVAVPIPLSKHRKQDAFAASAAAQLVALEADHATHMAMVNTEIARLTFELERSRAQLALYTKALLPQGRAAVTSTRASYEVGKVDFLAVLDAQATLFTYETDYAKACSDFAKNLAALERLVGQEVVE